MVNAKSAAVRQDYLEDDGQESVQDDSELSQDVDSDLDFGELDELRKEEEPVAVQSMEEVHSEIMDEHDGWLFESTITNLTSADLGLAKQTEGKEPGWRVLERRREEKELRDSLEESLFLDD